MKENYYETLLDALTNEMQALHKELQKCKEKLSQEPCEDAISRQAVIDTLTKTSGIRGDALKALYDLPSVTAQPKMGKWSRATDKTGHLVWECNKCGWQQRFNTNFCPDCGSHND